VVLLERAERFHKVLLLANQGLFNSFNGVGVGLGLETGYGIGDGVGSGVGIVGVG